jgi:galactokinase
MQIPSELRGDRDATRLLRQIARQVGLDIEGGRVRRTSSRFCLGVEHGDYNGTPLFGVGTDRFIWLTWKPNDSGRRRWFSGNFPHDGVIEVTDELPPPRSVTDSWARFAYGVEYILRREGFPVSQGLDGVIVGNIPGGGMSRSASLTLNLMLTLLEAHRVRGVPPMQIVRMAQAVENDYIGSPCGQLDQIMILFARAGMGTHFDPDTGRVRHVPLGSGAPDFRLVSLDTGTVRPGLEKSTYRIRRAECEELVQLAGPEFGIRRLADVTDPDLYRRILKRFGASHPDHCARLTYIFHAQRRFREMLRAWRRGDIEAVGRVFRMDGIGLRDDYRISGPELETMCDIARTVPGVLGERMLGGGDKGAAGAIVLASALRRLREAVERAYPLSHPAYADRFAVHELNVVDGVTTFDLS